MHPIRWCGHEWFYQCAISPLSLKATKDAGDERMTQVHEATLPIIIQGKDDLAQAKTGTGNTVAFLVLLAFSPTDQFDCHITLLTISVVQLLDLSTYSVPYMYYLQAYALSFVIMDRNLLLYILAVSSYLCTSLASQAMKLK